MEQVFHLKGLDCPNCAAQIEREAGLIDGIATAAVNLMNQTLTLTFTQAAPAGLLDAVIAIVRKHEPDVEVSVKSGAADLYDRRAAASNTDSAAAKRDLVTVAVGAAVYGLGVAVTYFFDLGLYVSLALLGAAYIVLGGKVVLQAVKNIAQGRIFDENFLMSVATVGAFIIGEYYEAVAVMLFYQVGELLQNLAVRRSRKSIAALMDIRPDAATVKRNGALLTVNPASLSVGEIIVVKPGEKIPLDGVVLDGSSLLDTKALTGESRPRAIAKGDNALSGCINLNGVLTIEVRKPFGESTAAKIIALVENAASRKAPTENFITTFSRYYTPAVVGLAALLALLPPLLGLGAWTEWLSRGCVFLVISCPCALVISIPLSFFGGIGGASRQGILVKGGNYLEALNALDMVVFDKTGTLTKGVFKVTRIEAAADFTENEVLRYAALAEAHSIHPIAMSIKAARGNQGGTYETGETDAPDEPVEHEEIAGQGVSVHVGRQTILVGNAPLLRSRGIDFVDAPGLGTKVYVAVDGRFAGSIVIADEIKPDSAATIKQLKSLGIRKTVMLTGDDRQIGAAVAATLGIDEVYAELLPGDKVEKLDWLDRQKRPRQKLAFVGDGINDAPVLARADIGIAMGGLGSDAAIEAADVVLMTDEPSKLIDAIAIARFTRQVVVQNIVFALGVKGVFLILGALGIANMWEAVFGDVGVALIAILNAMRVLRVGNMDGKMAGKMDGKMTRKMAR